ncbi:MAG TPA: M67 family metallopeptidase [Thermomicrobiaceae bacterium]|nr:M67 family metallopeptidase [Thermomicrobiaceae bacterium]
MAPADEFILSAALHRQMLDHLRRVAPEEGCGLIAYRDGCPVKIFEGTNTERSATRYNMDPGEVLAALNEMERHGWELGAIYHSHPRSAAEPSETDLAYYYYPDALMVIVSLAGPSPDLRAYRIGDQGREAPVRPVPVRIVEQAHEREQGGV